MKGYLTNTGIKFLAVVEDMGCSSTSASSIDNDDEDALFHYPSLPSWIDERSGTMESETRKMKKVFVSVIAGKYKRLIFHIFSLLCTSLSPSTLLSDVTSLFRLSCMTYMCDTQ